MTPDTSAYALSKPAGPKTRRIALVGNPNSGKTSLFNALTGLNQRVANYPGVTVEYKSGKVAAEGLQVELVDLPGAQSLYPQSADEAVTAHALIDPNHPQQPDAVIVVADATNLKKQLLLASQVIDLGLPTLLALNMSDLLGPDEARFLRENLKKSLGLETVDISARSRLNIKELKQMLAQNWAVPAPFFKIPEAFGSVVQETRAQLGLASDYAAYMLLQKPEEFPFAPAEKLARLRERAKMADGDELVVSELAVRYDRLGDLARAAAPAADSAAVAQLKTTRKLDRWLLHPVFGYVAMAALLLILFQTLFSWASLPMDLIDQGFGLLGEAVGGALGGGFLSDLATNGLLAGLQGVVIFVPQIALLFFFVAILEESGYMSRIVFLLDSLMQKAGISGKSVVPLIGGFACAIPSIMMTRNIPNPRERLITLMIVPLMSCSARLPVYTVLIAVLMPQTLVLGFFDSRALLMAGFYLFGIIVALLAAVVMRRFLPPGAESAFVAELPAYKPPRWRNVFLEMYNRSKVFVIDAGKIILVISIILWALASYGPNDGVEAAERQFAEQIEQAEPGSEHAAELARAQARAKLEASYAGHVGRFIEPVIKPLGYDWKIGIALLTSFAAREVFVGTMNTIYAAAETEDESAEFQNLTTRLQTAKSADGSRAYTGAVVLSLLVFYALAMQCMSTLAIVKRETGGWKYPLIMLAYQTGAAYLLALAAYQIARSFFG